VEAEGRTWKVYMLRCRDGELYTGCTVDLERRLKQHSSGSASKYTSSRGPVTLVYEETCTDRSSALRREYQIKQMGRHEKVRLVQTASATRQ
jgi:putative endonuclease